MSEVNGPVSSQPGLLTKHCPPQHEQMLHMLHYLDPGEIAPFLRPRVFVDIDLIGETTWICSLWLVKSSRSEKCV